MFQSKIIEADVPFMDESFQSTEILLTKIVAEFNEKSDADILCTLLPLKIDHHHDVHRFYPVVLSTDSPKIPWGLLENVAETILNLCFNISRIYVPIGNTVKHGVKEITKTVVNDSTCYMLSHADKIIESISRHLQCGDMANSHLPDADILKWETVMIPIHFDRVFTLPQYFPPICRSFCLKPNKLILPGKDIDETVIEEIAKCIIHNVPLTSRVFYDLTPSLPEIKSAILDSEKNSTIE